MRLIDADAFAEQAELKDWGNSKALWLNLSVFNNAPTVDAVEVVRCKDCWYSSVIPKEMQNVGEWHCEFWCAEMHGNDFCSCGKERR